MRSAEEIERQEEQQAEFLAAVEHNLKGLVAVSSGICAGCSRCQSNYGDEYRDAALSMLRSLSGPDYAAATGTNNHFLLMHSVGSQPGNSEVDVAINYADYYYLEALTRCAAL